MTRTLFALAFVLGAVAALWVALMLPPDNPVALVAIALIALVYGTGFMELRRFRRDTRALHESLRQPPADAEALTGWLARLPLALQAPVRRRTEGVPVALPGPSLTPYLTGLLVMLGLLGTFIGMIVTLRGAVSALQGGADLHAMRAALAAPIAGMSLAFGTSIAGVATSAMLGLAAALSRNERQQAGRELDAGVHRELGRFSQRRQRQQVQQALLDQARAFPAAIEQLGVTLAASQTRFQEHLEGRFQTLADTLATAQHAQLAESARLSGEQARQLTGDTLAQLSVQAEQHLHRLGDMTGQRLTALGDRFQAMGERAAQHWHDSQQQQQQAAQQLVAALDSALQDHLGTLQQQTGTLMAHSRHHHDALQQHSEQQFTAHGELLRTLTRESAAQWRDSGEQQHALGRALIERLDAALASGNEQFRATTAGLLQEQQAGIEALTSQTARQLHTLHEQEAAQAEAALERLDTLQHSAARQLATLGQALEAPMARLIDTASQAPAAATRVIEQLRTEMTRASERDNTLLEERQRIIGELDALLATQRETTRTQQNAIETLIHDSGQILGQVGATLSAQIQTQAERLDQATAEITGSGHDIASLSDAFATAVQQFGESNRTLVDSLTRVETALAKAGTRSDEQLAYYVEQAREVIDLSLSAQKEVLDTLGTLDRSRTAQGQS